MKFYTLYGLQRKKRGLFFKTRVVMKLTVLLMTIVFLTGGGAHGQNTPPGSITLAEKDASLNKVFKDLARKSKYQFFYQDELLAKLDKVSFSVQNATLQQVLDLCLKDKPLTYSIVGNTVVIKKKELASPEKTGSATGQIKVEGRVVDENGLPLSGATVQIKNGKQQVTITNEKGLFTLNIVENNAILVITMIGFDKKELPATANMGDIKLNVANSKLDEVKVIAYGTTSQRLNTGDVITVKAADIEKQPVSNPLLALEGRVPGMYIMQTNGLPGSASAVQIQIRGSNSIQHSGDPLYIVDGVPYASTTLNSGASGQLFGNTSGNPFNFLNPADIESISVLKDADATSIYGSRGANGVVLITTKKGKADETKVDFNVQDGYGEVPHEMKLLNLRQYLNMRYEAFKNDGAVPNPNVDYDLTLWDTTRSTDWQKKLIGGTAQRKDVQVSLSGGSANTQFLIGSSYHRETTVFPGNWNDEKASVHLTINNSSFKNRLKTFLSVNYIKDQNDLGQFDLTEMAMTLPPDAPPLTNPDGTLNWAPNSQGVTTWTEAINPLATFASKINISTNNLIGKASVSYQALSGLEIKTALGYTMMQNTGFSDTPFAMLDPSTWGHSQRSSRFANNQSESWIIEPQATYNTTIAGGSITALLGATIEQNLSQGQVWNAAGFSSDLSMNNILAATTITAIQNSYALYKYSALFGRLNYNWQDTYLLDLVARRDGSSRFGPENRFANFYSVGGGWIFSKADAIHKYFPALSYGKLRASFGTTGNDQIGDYAYLDLYRSIPGIGIPYQGINAITPTTIYTPNLQWELTKKMEVGLETGFLQDRVLLSISYYYNRSSNQLIFYPLPSITGFTSIQENLPATLQNTGTELELTTVNIKNQQFRWTTSFNISQNTNKLVRISPGMGGYFPELIGRSLNALFLYHFAGVDPITGVNQYINSQGNKVFQPDAANDKIVYQEMNPKYFGGLQNSVSFKNFQLDFLFYFVKHVGQVFPYFGAAPGMGYNQPVTVLSRWQKPGDVTNIQKFSQNGTLYYSNSFYALQSDQVFQDASFIRLKNLSLSYLLAGKMLQSWHLQSARLYVHADNLLTFTNYQGLDPESLSITTLPPLRVITVGVEAVF